MSIEESIPDPGPPKAPERQGPLALVPGVTRRGARLDVPRASSLRRRATALAYAPPRPGHSLRSGLRTAVMLGGSVGIGTGVALGAFGIGPAALLAVGLATAQVIAQSVQQNRLGQRVMAGLARGELEEARLAAERALEASPGGAMRTLAAANLASVLMQSDRIEEGAMVLDRWPPGVLHMPLSTVLWMNNRAFASLLLEENSTLADALLSEAEQRLEGSGPRGLGGVHNHRKISSALAGTRAMERLAAGHPDAALASLALAARLDDAPRGSFRAAEREICRIAALTRLGRVDEAELSLVLLGDQPLTARQRARLEALREERHSPGGPATDA